LAVKGGEQELTYQQQLTIGGDRKYAKLRDGLVIASVNPNAKQTEVSVHAYLVKDITTFF
jgi:hypothetical protein